MESTVCSVSKYEKKVSTRILSSTKKVKFCVARSELDSHADTCVAGSNCVVLEYTGQKVKVSPFTEEYKPIEGVPIARCATAIDLNGGETLILVINEALFFGNRMTHTLLCPNQLRANGLIVDDVPKQFDNKSRHAVVIPRTSTESELVLPLEMKGIISFLQTRRPTKKELEECSHVELTSPHPWEPYSQEFGNNEKCVEKDLALAQSGHEKFQESQTVAAMHTDEESEESNNFPKIFPEHFDADAINNDNYDTTQQPPTIEEVTRIMSHNRVVWLIETSSC